MCTYISELNFPKMANICYIVNNSQTAIKKLLIDNNVNGSENTCLLISHDVLLATWVSVFLSQPVE